jgi:hypothetical protein
LLISFDFPEKNSIFWLPPLEVGEFAMANEDCDQPERRWSKEEGEDFFGLSEHKKSKYFINQFPYLDDQRDRISNFAV